jgi:hypothetical protein
MNVPKIARNLTTLAASLMKPRRHVTVVGYSTPRMMSVRNPVHYRKGTPFLLVVPTILSLVRVVLMGSLKQSVGKTNSSIQQRRSIVFYVLDSTIHPIVRPSPKLVTMTLHHLLHQAQRHAFGRIVAIPLQDN